MRWFGTSPATTFSMKQAEWPDFKPASARSARALCFLWRKLAARRIEAGMGANGLAARQVI